MRSPTQPESGPVAGAVDTLALERIAIGTWVPDTVEEVGDWVLRAAEGFTGRANSALVLGDPGQQLDDRLVAVRAWYAARDLPPLVAVPLPAMASVHRRMAAAGWTVHHGGRVMVRELDGLPPRRVDPAVAIEHVLTDEWVAHYHYRGGELPSVGHRLLARGDRVALASSRDGDRVVAIARGTVSDGWLGINAVETAPTHRRQGRATDLLAALAGWGRDQGAQAVFLQVDLANDAAHAMYRHAGFLDHHTYHYLQRPGD